MGKKLCLDSDVIINHLKGNDESISTALKNGQNLYTTSINSFELRLRKTNIGIIDDFLKNIKVLAFDDFSGEIASYLYKRLGKKGNKLDLKDLFIASICIRNDMPLLTENKKHFKRVKDLKLAR